LRELNFEAAAKREYASQVEEGDGHIRLLHLAIRTTHVKPNHTTQSWSRFAESTYPKVPNLRPVNA